MGTSPLQGHQRIANEIAENIVSLNNSTGPYGAVSFNFTDIDYCCSIIQIIGMIKKER